MYEFLSNKDALSSFASKLSLYGILTSPIMLPTHPEVTLLLFLSSASIYIAKNIKNNINGEINIKDVGKDINENSLEK